MSETGYGEQMPSMFHRMHELSPRFFCFLLAWAPLQATASDFNNAVAAFKSAHDAAARAAFERLLAKEPKNAAVHYYLGRIALRHSDGSAAAAELAKAVKLDSTRSDYFFWLGTAYGILARDHHSFTKALACKKALLRAVNLDPDNLDARAALVTFYRQAPFFVGGSLSRARAQAKEISRRNPIRGKLARGEILIVQKKYDEAVAAYQDLLKSHPEQIAALYMIGYVAATTGHQLELGEAALKQYLGHKPDDIQPSLAYAHLRLGNIYERENKTAAARAEYRAALDLVPNFTAAAGALAGLK
ncbi:MAG: tetratricopeptide repeat protein [Verrucomicrobiota bacterium]|nr:tetratricopeptide repeat protein [Verrucomicrobiota bacterium]